MPTCIYCRTSDTGKFPREHVVPRSFGSFRGALTLRCVCGACNRSFGKHLETPFARESAESIARFWHGVRDEESATRTSQAAARVNDSGPRQGAKVLLRPNARKNGIDLQYVPQVAFRKNEAEEWRWYTPEELNSQVIQALDAGWELKYFVSSPVEEQRLRSRLQELGLPATKPVRRQVFPPEPEIKTHVKCIFDLNMARCVAKIAFNYFAYVLEQNYQLLLRDEFDPIRRFVTDGTHPQYSIVQFSGKPALDRPTNEGAFVVGHALGVDWVADGSIVCELSLFNAMAYRVVICNAYRGLWFPLGNAHTFDFRSKKAANIPLSVFVGSLS
jgi:HNH endonuclease